MDSLARMVIVSVLLFSVWEVSYGARTMGTEIQRFTECRTFNFTKESHYDINRDHLLKDLEVNTVKSEGRKYSTESSSAPVVFGQANCTSVLTKSSCIACLRLAANVLQTRCPTQLGAVAAFGDCFLEYNSHPLDQ